MRAGTVDDEEGFSEEVRRRTRRRAFRAAALVAIAALEFTALAVSPDLAASLVEECKQW